MVPYRAVEEEGRHAMPSEATLLRSTPLELHACASELLFRRCRDGGDPAAREELALRYLPLACKVARRYAPSSVPYEDLVQVASLALLKAIDRYDCERGTRFEAFAIPTILGELKRYFRDSTWSVHVTREAQERARAIARASERLVGGDGRGPTVGDLALYLELSEEEVLEGLQAAQAYTATSLDAPVPSAEGDGESTVASQLGAEDGNYDLVETQMAVADAVQELSESEQAMLKMRFVEEMTQSEIGTRLGVSQMQVSRLLRRMLERLRTRLKAADE
jgi:RNA polymerase sigma-B factor